MPGVLRWSLALSLYLNDVRGGGGLMKKQLAILLGGRRFL
jgi:hypothetical protein